MEPGWLLVWFGGLALVHLVVLAVMLRGRSIDGGRSAGTGDADARECAECGTVNDPAYRYCRSCVSTLGRTPVTGADDQPGRRRVP
jgi:hypothetical protein